MKSFQFRLEKILQLRTFDEENAKIELGRCIGEVNKIKNILEHIAEEKILTRKSMGLKNFQLHDFLIAETYLKNLEAKKEEMLEALTLAELKVEKAQSFFLEAAKKRKILSKLKEKQELAWKKEVQTQNDAILDDIVNAKKWGIEA